MLKTTIRESPRAGMSLCALVVLAFEAIAFGQTRGAEARDSRFEPSFRSDVHPLQAEDAPLVRILRNYDDKRLAKSSFLLVHGHFFNDGNEAAVVTALMHESRGDSLTTFVLSKGARGWDVRSHDNSLNAAYCKVIPASTEKDILLCQTNYAGPAGIYGTEEVSTNLNAIDFAQTPADSFFFHLRDTVSTGSSCLSWANLESVVFKSGVLRVRVDYGRKQLPGVGKVRDEFRKRALGYRGSPSGFPHRIYDIEFKLGPAGFRPSENSKNDLAYVTEPWEKTCQP